MSASSSQVVSPGGSASPGGVNRTDQIVHRVYLKTVGILVDGRLTHTHTGSGRTGGDERERKRDKWFNIIIPDAEIYKADLQVYKAISSYSPAGDSAAPPLLVAFILDTSDLPNNQALMWNRESGRATIDTASLGGKGKGKERQKGGQSGIVLERWTFEASEAITQASGSQIAPHTAYRMGIIHFRSLFALLRLLPAYKLYRRLRRTNNGLRLGLKLWAPEGYPRDQAGLAEAWAVMEQGLIGLDVGLETLVNQDIEPDQEPQRYEMPSLDMFGSEYRLSVDFRPDVDFHVDDLESVLSEKLVDMEEDWFTPTVARHRMEGGSSNPSSSAASSIPSSRRVPTPTTIPSSNPAPIPQRQGPASIGSFQTGLAPSSGGRRVSAQSHKAMEPAISERWGAIGEGLPFAASTSGQENRPGSAASGAAITARRLSGHSIQPFTSSSPSPSYLRNSPSGATQGPSPTLAPRPSIAHSSSIGRTSSFLSQSGRSFTHAQLANMHPSSASPPVTGAMSREHLPLGSSPNTGQQAVSPSSLSFSKQPLPRSLSGRPPYSSAQGSSPFIPGSYERDTATPSSMGSTGQQPPHVIKRYSSSLGQSQRPRVSSYGSSVEGSSVPGSQTQPQNLLRRSSTRMSTESGLRHSLEAPDPAAGNANVAVNVADNDDIQSFLKTLDSLPQPPSLAAQAATSRVRQPSASSSLSNNSLRQTSSPLPTSNSAVPAAAAASSAQGTSGSSGRAPITRAQIDDAVRRMTGSFAATAISLEQSNVIPSEASTALSNPNPKRSSPGIAPSVGLLTASRPTPAPRRVTPASFSSQSQLGRRSSIDENASSSPPTGRSASVKKNSPLSGEPLQPPTPGPVVNRAPPTGAAAIEADSRAVRTALPLSPPPPPPAVVPTALAPAPAHAKSTARSLPAGPAPLTEDSPVPLPGRPGHPSSGFLSPQPTGSAYKRDTSAAASQRRGPVLLRGGFDGRSQSPSHAKSGHRQSTSPSRSPIRDFSRLATAPGASRIPASASVGTGTGAGTATGGGISGEQHAEAELIGWRRYRSEQRIQGVGGMGMGKDAPALEQGAGAPRRQSTGAGNVLAAGTGSGAGSSGNGTGQQSAAQVGGQGQRTAPSSLGRDRREQEEGSDGGGGGGGR